MFLIYIYIWKILNIFYHIYILKKCERRARSENKLFTIVSARQSLSQNGRRHFGTYIGNTLLALHKPRAKINISWHIPISTHKPVRIYPAWSYLPPPEFHTWKRSSRQARRCHRGSRRDRHWNLDRLEPWLDTGGKTHALVYVYMAVSKNRGTPKSSFLVRMSASIQHHSAPAIGV